MIVKLLDRVALLKLMLFVGLLQIAAYWFSGAMNCVDGTIAVPQPDTPLYYQAARRIVEGHPFSFSEGTAVCTGTTTIIYPFVLAIPYALGCTGDSMLIAGFVFNALFYLIFLVGWWVAIKNWIDRLDVQLVACCLVAMSGHCAYVTFAQSDIGFWLAFSALLAAALSSNNNWWIGFLLVFAPWVRPEGMIYTLAYFMVTVGSALFLRGVLRLALRNYFIAVAGVLSSIGVFVFNYYLTGHCQFASVAGKGYFSVYTFAQAVFASVGDLFVIIKEILFGLSKSMPRDILTFPVLGGLFMLGGIVAYKCKREHLFGFLVTALAAVGGVLSIAQSGWQGTNMDRYLVWLFPVAYMFIAGGVIWLERFMPHHMRRLPSSMMLSFALIGCVSAPFVFAVACKGEDCVRHFAHACEDVMEKGASLGGSGGCGLIYYGTPRRCAHICGIYSPEFSPKLYLDTFEKLRYEPELRFDYWLVSPDLVGLLGETVSRKLGEVELAGPSAMTLVKADWSMFEPVVTAPDASMKLVARVDVGYDKEERSADYNVITRWGYEVFEPYIQGGMLRNKYIVDVGRVILGGDEMNVPLAPGHDAVAVMRVWPRHEFYRRTGTNNSKMDCAFTNPLKLNLSVDGNIVDLVEAPFATNAFTDVSIKIPGAAIKNPVSRVGFLGDHIAFGYWFYQ